MFHTSINDKLTIKIFEERDLEALYELVDGSRDYLVEYLPWVKFVKKPEDELPFIKEGLQQFANGNGFQCGLWYEGQLAGVVGLHYIHQQNKMTSLGYYLGEEFQGKGIMTQAVAFLLDYLFNDLGLNRVEIRAAVTNHKSQAIPKRLGFTEEGILRQDEQLDSGPSDSYVFSLLRDEYLKQQEIK
ncbi:GNAT family protein [Aerococcaceae bacterium 50-4]